MDWLLEFVAQNAHLAHWIFFGALMLAGVNVPVSEDLILLLSGGLAATAGHDHAVALFVLPFLGAYLSDFIGYGVGRWMGPRLMKWEWLVKRLGSARLEKVQRFYDRHGVWTLLVGRLIPFGVRNCLFVMAGVGGVKLRTFIWADLIPCLTTNALLYTLGYWGAKQGAALLPYLSSAHLLIFGLFLVAVVGFLVWRRVRRRAISKI
jgi:membrane-associated protein